MITIYISRKNESCQVVKIETKSKTKNVFFQKIKEKILTKKTEFVILPSYNF